MIGRVCLRLQADLQTMCSRASILGVQALSGQGSTAQHWIAAQCQSYDKSLDGRIEVDGEMCLSGVEKGLVFPFADVLDRR